MTEKRIKALEDEVRGLRSRVEKLEKALKTLLPTEGDLTWDGVIRAALKGDRGPMVEWKRRGYPIPGMKE